MREPSGSSAPRVMLVLPGLGGGGAERVAVGIMQAIPEAERHLVLFERKVAYAYDATLHVLAGDFTSGGPLVPRLRQLAKNVAALARLKRSLRPASCLSFTTWANIVNVLAGHGGRTVLSSHNCESKNIRGRLAPILRVLVRLTYPRADRIVAVSAAVRDDLIENFGVPPERVETIHNSVDGKAIARLADEPLSPDLERFFANHSTIVTAGSLSEQKGQWHLIRIFAALKKQRPELRLVVLGEGPLAWYLSSLADDSGLRVHAPWVPVSAEVADADVVFTGFTENPFAYFARATIFAFPSLWEGFGMVILEALACGAAALVSDCPAGPREIVAPGLEGPSVQAAHFGDAGVLLPELDGCKRPAVESLSRTESVWMDALARVLDEVELRKGLARHGRSRAEAFSAAVLGPRWHEVLLGSRTPSTEAGEGNGARTVSGSV